MVRSVGLEISLSKVKALLVESSARQITISKYAEKDVSPLSEKWGEEVTSAIKEIFTKNSLPTNNVVVSIDCSRAIIREVFVPFKNEEQIARTIKAEAEALTYKYTAEQMIVAYHKTGEIEKGSHVVIVAVAKEIIKQHLSILEKVGIDPVAIDIDFFALFNTLKHFNKIEPEPLLLLYAEGGYMKFGYINQATPRLARSTKLPTPQTTFEEVIVLLEERDETHADIAPTQTKRRTAWDLFVSEMKKIIFQASQEKQLSHILCLGSSSNIETLKTLEWQLQIPVKIVDYISAVKHQLKMDDAQLKIAIPLGLALKGIGIDHSGVDLRKEEFTHKKKAEAIKSALTTTMLLLIILFGIMGIYFYNQNLETEKQIQQVLERQEKIYQTVFPEIALKDPKQVYKQWHHYYTRAKEAAGYGKYPLEVSTTHLLYYLTETINRVQNYPVPSDKSELYLELKNIVIKQSMGYVNIFGYTNIAALATFLRDNLQRYPVYGVDPKIDVKETGPVPGREGILQFRLVQQKKR